MFGFPLLVLVEVAIALLATGLVAPYVVLHVALYVALHVVGWDTGLDKRLLVFGLIDFKDLGLASVSIEIGQGLCFKATVIFKE